MLFNARDVSAHKSGDNLPNCTTSAIFDVFSIVSLYLLRIRLFQFPFFRSQLSERLRIDRTGAKVAFVESAMGCLKLN